jgi:hypothetical protein
MFDRFGAALYGPSYRDPERGYAAYIEVDSWIDHHLLDELAKNPDGMWNSNYFHKRRAGKIEMGPIWDFDRSMNPDGDDRTVDPTGWSGPRLLGWWARLFEDPAFVSRTGQRWKQLRLGPMRTENLHAILDAMAEEIRDAVARNFERWPDVGPGPDGWQVGQVDRLKRWLAQRAAWLDEAMDLAPP